MSDQAAEIKGLKLNDHSALRVVKHYQKQTGDTQAGKTLARLVLAAFAAGVRIAPEINSPATGPTQPSQSPPPAAAAS